MVENAMKRSEKALAPEWLKGASGGRGSTPHHSSSSSQSDDRAISSSTRSRSTSVSSSDHDSPRSVVADRTPSSYFQRSSSSDGAMMRDKDSLATLRSSSSFGRSRHERGWDKDLDFQYGDYDITDSLTLTSRMEKDKLTRSQSLISRRQGEVWHNRVGNYKSNRLPSGGSNRRNINKAASERDFPSLGAEEKQGVPVIGRVSSPGLSFTPQSPSIGTAALSGGEGWSSALAGLPVAVGGNRTSASFKQASVSSACSTTSTMTYLNMAETSVQTSARTSATSQSYVDTQRFGELTIRQSRQLRPMTHSMSKTSVLNPIEKPKSKTMRSSELRTVTKVGQQLPSSQLVNQTVHGTNRSDVSKPSQAGKLTVLRATREMVDVSSTSKDGCNPPNDSRVPPVVIQSASTVTQSSSMDRKSLTQTQNRSDFFNSLRKKVSEKQSAAVPDSIPTVSSMSEKSDDQIAATTASGIEGKDAPASDCDLGWSPSHNSDVADNGDSCKGCKIFSDDGEKDLSSGAVLFPDEEEEEKEIALLRSMGWQENAEEAPLTDEEINAFYELLRLRQSSELPQGVQQRKSVPFESLVGSLGDASSTSSSSDSESEDYSDAIFNLLKSACPSRKK